MRKKKDLSSLVSAGVNVLASQQFSGITNGIEDAVVDAITSSLKTELEKMVDNLEVKAEEMINSTEGSIIDKNKHIIIGKILTNIAKMLKQASK